MRASSFVVGNAGILGIGNFKKNYFSKIFSSYTDTLFKAEGVAGILGWDGTQKK
jgi:hypothetical protein